MDRTVEEMMKCCSLCARSCEIDRTKWAGRCGETDKLRAARAALHMWEEPCISGKNGSGAVFFSGCPLGCVFCQNRNIALGNVGETITTERLRDIFYELQKKGAHNINLVTPTHFVPQIAEAVRWVKAEGFSLPFVYNTASYEKQETIRLLEGVVDIFLPDLKYCDPEIAVRYSDAPDYFETASKAIAEMVRIAGVPVFDENGMMMGGTIVRHMIMPGHTKDSKAVIRYLYEMYGDEIYISIMNQYTPMPGIEARYPELGRKVTKREYKKVIDYALELGVTQAFIQEGGAAMESFIPVFNGEGVRKK